MPDTIETLLEHAVSAAPNRVAATLGDAQLTFLECARASARLAYVLDQWGVRKHDQILYWADVSLRAIDLFFACSYAGAIFVPANPAFSRSELDAVLDYLQPSFIIVDPAHQEEGIAAARRVGAKLGVISAIGSTVADFDLDAAASIASERTPPRRADSSDPNVMFLTSGSTGRPKAVVISQRAHWLRSASSPSYDAVCGGRGTANMFPLFHMAGWLMILQAFGRRRAVHLTRQASAYSLWSIIEKHRPQELYCIPAVWRRLLETAHEHDGSCLSMALTGTSRVEPDLLAQIQGSFPNASTGIFYGSTEMGVSLGIAQDDIDAHPYSVGMPMPNVEARLVDGELWLRGETVMDGYFGLPEETREVLQGGWYRSGDLATVDPDGYYEIVGRRREIIRTGGESVAPAEVEAAMADMAGVREVAVVGLPDEAWGEIICAVIVVDEGSDPPAIEAIRAHLNSRLAPFKQPRLVRTRTCPLPRTGATGQVQRGMIREELLTKPVPD